MHAILSLPVPNVFNLTESNQNVANTPTVSVQARGGNIVENSSYEFLKWSLNQSSSGSLACVWVGAGQSISESLGILKP